jgi:hypothetical protein
LRRSAVLDAFLDAWEKANHPQLIDFGFSFSLFYATSQGLGLHDYDIPTDNRPRLSRADYAFTVLYVSRFGP